MANVRQLGSSVQQVSRPTPNVHGMSPYAKFLFLACLHWCKLRSSELNFSDTTCYSCVRSYQNYRAGAVIQLADDTNALLTYWGIWWRGPLPCMPSPNPFVDFFCIVTQQTAKFWGEGPRRGACDPQIRNRARFLYIARNRQVSSSYV